MADIEFDIIKQDESKSSVSKQDVCKTNESDIMKRRDSDSIEVISSSNTQIKMQQKHIKKTKYKIIIIFSIFLLIVGVGISFYILFKKYKKTGSDDDPKENDTTLNNTNENNTERNDTNVNNNDIKENKPPDQNETEHENCIRNCRNDNECIKKCDCIKDCNKNKDCENNCSKCNSNICPTTIYSKYSYSLKKENKLTIPQEYDVNNTLENNSFESINENYDISLYFYENLTDYLNGYLFMEKSSINNVNNGLDKNYVNDDEYKEEIPIVKFSLSNKNGTISNESYNEKIDKNEGTILKSFLDQLSIFYNKYLNEKKTEFTIYENTSILNNATILFTVHNSNLSEEGFINNYVKKEFFNLSYDELFQKILNDSNVTGQNIRKGILKEYYVKTETNINLKNSLDADNIKTKLIDLINNINFKTYNELIEDNEEERRILNEKNNKKIKSHHSQKRNLKIASFLNPEEFKYELFKIVLSSGDIIGLGASIGLFPLNSSVVIQLIFEHNSEETVLFELIDDDNNFKEIAEKLKEIYLDIAIIIAHTVDKLDKNLDGYKNEIISNISNIINNIKDIKGVKEAFQIGLDDLYIISTSKTIDGFNNSINASNLVFDYLKDLYFIISDNTSDKINLLKSNSNKLIEDLLILEENNLHKIENYTNQFYYEMINEIQLKNESNIEIILDIESFYTIKEELDDIEKFFVNFEENFTSYLNDKLIYYDNYIEEEFNSTINNNLLDIEFIAQEAQINPIIIDNYSNETKSTFINKVQSFRKKIEDIFNSFTRVFKNILKSDSEFKLKIINDEYISKQRENFINKKERIISELERIIKVNTNFTIYIDDLKLIYEIERELQEKRIKLFNSIFVEAIDNITFDLTEEVIDNFEKQIDNKTEEILEINVRKKDFAKINLLRETRDIIDNFIGTIIKNIQNTYNNETLITNKLELIYNELNITASRFSNDFYVRFEKNVEKYVSPPYEIPFKFNYSVHKQVRQRYVMYRQIENLITKYISYIYSEKKIIIEEIIKRKYTSIIDEMPDNLNNDIPGFDIYKNELSNVFNLSNKLNNNLNIKSSELKHINNTIALLENQKIAAHISQLNAQIETKMNSTFCLGTHINFCSYKKNISKSIIYNYQIAKIRSALSDLRSSLKYSEYVINETNLNTFYIDEYYDEFNENVNFNFNKFLNNIIIYFTNISQIENDLIDPYLKSIKDTLKNAFLSNINEPKIIANFENFCQYTFYIPREFNIKKNDESWILENKIKEIFVQKIEDYMNYENLYGFFFNESQFTRVYKEFYNKIIELYNYTYKKINNSLNLNEQITNYIINYQGEIIENGTEEIKQYLKNLSEISPKIELLNNTFSVSEIDLSEIDILSKEIKSSYSSQFKSIISEKFNSLILNQILKLFNDSQKIILERLEDEKVIMETYLQTHSRTMISHENTIKIDNMSDYEDKLIEAFEEYYDNFYQLFSYIRIKDMLFENIKSNITQLDFEFNFDNITNEIMITLGSILDSASMMYNTERKEFSEKIYEFIEELFKEGMKIYIENFGLHYYDAVVDQDFYNNIYPELYYIREVINEIKEYTSLLFNASNFTEVSVLIRKTLSSIYLESKDIIKNNTENKVEKIIYYILDEKTETLRDLIIKGFNDKIVEKFNSLELKKYLNKKIIALLPNDFSNFFKEKLKQYYMDLTKEIILSEIKNNFKILLDEELKLLYDELDETQKFTNNLLISYSTFQIDDSTRNLLNIYNDYSNNIQHYNYLSINENYQENITNIIKNLMNEITDKLSSVSEKYFINFEEAKIEIGNLIDKNLDFVNKFKEVLNPENRINNTKISYEKITSTIEKIKDYSRNLFLNINSEFENISKDEREKKEKELGLEFRRLVEFKNYYIDGFLKQLEKKYDLYGQTISGLEEYVKLSSSNYLFLSKMKNELSSASNYINSTYLYLKYIYPEEKLEKYFSNIESNEEEIQILSYQFLRNESFIIDKTLKLIKKDVLKLYPNIEEGLKKDIINSLNIKIPNIMRELKTMERINSSEIKNITIIPENDSTNYLLKSNSVGYINGNFSTNYSFNINIDEGFIIFNSSLKAITLGQFTNIFDIIEENIDGTLGNSEIGLNLNYSIFDEKLYKEFYVVQKRDYENYHYKFADTIFKNSQLINGLNLTKSLKDYYSRTQKEL